MDAHLEGVLADGEVVGKFGGAEVLAETEFVEHARVGRQLFERAIEATLQIVGGIGFGYLACRIVFR